MYRNIFLCFFVTSLFSLSISLETNFEFLAPHGLKISTPDEDGIVSVVYRGRTTLGQPIFVAVTKKN